MRLREQGFDAAAAVERGWGALADEALFRACVVEERALVTNNARDFVPLAREWTAAGENHFGLILTNDRSWSRSRDGIGRLADALAVLLADHGSAGLFDRVHWL